MTHAYIFKLEKLGKSYYVYRFIENKLKKILGSNKLEEVIITTSHILNYEDGAHNLLFWLKTFELDILRKQKLGTIGSYGREEMLKNIIVFED